MPPRAAVSRLRLLTLRAGGAWAPPPATSASPAWQSFRRTCWSATQGQEAAASGPANCTNLTGPSSACGTRCERAVGRPRMRAARPCLDRCGLLHGRETHSVGRSYLFGSRHDMAWCPERRLTHHHTHPLLSPPLLRTHAGPPAQQQRRAAAATGGRLLPLPPARSARYATAAGSAGQPLRGPGLGPAPRTAAHA